MKNRGSEPLKVIKIKGANLMSKILKAIRKKCVDCSSGSYKEVKLCPLKDCSLYPYRFGNDGKQKRKKFNKEKLLKK